MASSTHQQNIKDLPSVTLTKLAQILDHPHTPNWRELIQVMPVNIYRKDHIERFGMETLKPNGSPAKSLLFDLAKRNITVTELVTWIQKLPDSPGRQSLLQLCMAPVISTEPVDIQVGVGGEAVLSCGVFGQGHCQFQWFKSETQLADQTQSNLYLQNVTQNDEGSYVCRVANLYGYVFSKWAKIQVSEEQVSPLPAHLCQPIVNKQPKNPAVQVVFGGRLHLYCDAVGNPAPVYQWFKDDIAIRGATGREYTKPNMCIDDEGVYVCVASNSSGVTPSKPSHVSVVKLPVSDKIALLIGNQDYQHAKDLGPLYHPMNDVCDLGGILSSIGFKVVSLVNLTLEEMDFALHEFYKLLDDNTYAFFYFAGHGFELQGQSYLMPVDATSSYAPEGNMMASSVLDVMQRSKAKLIMVVLDCCRTIPNGRRNRLGGEERSVSLCIERENVIVIFGCLPQHPVFECEAERNGYIAKCLLRHIGQHKPVHQIIFEFSKGIKLENIIDPNTGKQQLVHSQTTITDEIWLTAETGFESAGAIGWRKAHEIPDTVVILEEEGLVVELLFMAEFSNVLLVTARCRPESSHVNFNLPPNRRILGCSIQPLSGKEPNVPALFRRTESGIRVADLQRLQGDLELSVTVSTGTITRTISYEMAEKPLYAKIACSRN